MLRVQKSLLLLRNEQTQGAYMGRLDTTLLWGHSLDDYRDMFALEENDLNRSILDYGAGPASFSAQMKNLGHFTVATDPIYDQSPELLAEHFEKEFSQMRETVEQHPERFIWDTIPSPNALEEKRRETTQLFLNDYKQGLKEKRYLYADYPDLPFEPDSFDLVLASHAVFITHADKPPEFISDLLMTLIDLANEVRVFPLLDGDGNISPLVGPVLLALQQNNLCTEIREVNYEFQRGGNAMFRIWVD